jgi:hypothetical protein
MADGFETWMRGLESRHLARFEFAEVRKALQALSSLYVERREKLATGAALGTEGKRAAFALFYAPLHFLFVREVVRRLEAAPGLERVIDLGCGTAPAGAAWASEGGAGVRLEGYERNGWAAGEARHTLAAFGLRGRVHTADLMRVERVGQGAGIVAAFAVNELDDAARMRLRDTLLEAAREGARVLVVEPLARGVARWWPEWQEAYEAAGGRADEWRFRVDLPEIVRRLDKAAGLDHRELKGRTLWLPGRTQGRAVDPMTNPLAV